MHVYWICISISGKGKIFKLLEQGLKFFQIWKNLTVKISELTPLEPSSRNGWALRVSGFAFQMPTTVMKPKAVPVAILSQRLSVRDSWKSNHVNDQKLGKKINPYCNLQGGPKRMAPLVVSLFSNQVFFIFSAFFQKIIKDKEKEPFFDLLKVDTM